MKGLSANLWLCIVGVAFTVLVSGCIGTGIDMTKTVKALPEVESFLKDHPNAELKIVLLPKNYVSDQISDIRFKCGDQMTVQEYWKADVKEGDVKLEAWLDSTGRAICVLKPASQTTTTTTLKTTTTTLKESSSVCINAKLTLDTYAYDKDTGQLIFIVNNDGRASLDDFSLTVNRVTGSETFSLKTDDRVANKQSSPLSPGEPRSFIVNNLSSLVSFKVTTNCGESAFVEKTIPETEKSISIPSGSTTCNNGLVTVRVKNKGDSTITDLDIITAQINGQECAKSPLSLTSGQAAIIINAQGCGNSCNKDVLCSGKTTVRVGTRSGAVETTALC